MSQNNDNSSGSDNVDLTRLLKMAKSIADDNMRKKNANTSLIDIDKCQKDIDQEPSVNSGSPAHVNLTDPIVPKKIIEFDPVYALIYGYKFPKTTIYFTLICLIIAVIIFYITSPKKQVKTDKNKQ